MQGTDTIRILLVEDDEIDRIAVVRGLEKAGLDAEIRVAKDGIEGLEVLRGEADGCPARPYIVLLDLNMPRLDGLSMLRELRKDEALRRNVVFIISTSESEQDQKTAYDLLVSGYIVKSHLGKDYAKLAHLVRSYWDVVELPLD